MVQRNARVQVRLGEREIDVAVGTPVGDVLAEHADVESGPLLAAMVDHRCVDTDFPLVAATTIQPVTYAMREGVLVYRRTASLVLLEAARRLWGDRAHLSVGQSLSNGYVYEVHLDGEDGLSEGAYAALEAEMWRLIGQDLPLRREQVSLAEAKRLFAGNGNLNRLRLLKAGWAPQVELVYCGEFVDIHHYPVAARTGMVGVLELDYHPPKGVLLRFPRRQSPDEVPPFEDSPKLRQVYSETRTWLRLLDVSTVGQLNALTLSGQIGELLRIAEGLHEKKIAQIADQICQADRSVRVVAVAGPSASGKTTFSKRLSLQLRVNGVRPVALSTDNFYVDREATPRDENGDYDFEALEAIDLPLFNEVLARLLAGEEVETPRFDFTTGKRRPRERWSKMRLAEDQVLVIEGIHGLNPRLTEAVEEQRKFRVYVSALTQLCIDDHNRIFTSDTRFLRRIVRDRMFRGYSAEQTIEVWPRVRRGEQRWIFPYQEAADVMFNSALVYEHAVLRLYAERFLLEVSDDTPAYASAYRLLRFLSHFVPVFDEHIPQTSLLREFTGGSYFSY
jgi:uridine kinase